MVSGFKLLCRSDPDPSVKGWQANNRGLSYTFGPDVVMETCQKLDIDLIARAHQVVQVLNHRNFFQITVEKNFK